MCRIAMFNSGKEGNDYDASILVDCLKRKLRQRKWRLRWMEATLLPSVEEKKDKPKSFSNPKRKVVAGS